jgi:thymidylate synthase (FAD)
MSTLDPLGDGKSLVQLVDSMGSSLSIVNDARQSFEARSEEFTQRDEKLVNYLARERHTSPFRGVVFKFYVKCPLYIARQWWKHVIASTYVDDQLGWNEKSYRYCSAEDAEFYVPRQFLKQGDTSRQASGDPLSEEIQQLCQGVYASSIDDAILAYHELLHLGVSKEQARGILPPCLYTSFVWTCSLQALFHFISLRANKETAQSEIAAYAQALFELGSPVAPEAFDAFRKAGYNF